MGYIQLFEKVLIILTQLAHIYIIITVRADFYPELMTMKHLFPKIRQYRYEILPMGEDALRSVIYKPAENVWVHIDPVLVERLVADAGREPSILPFVQATMKLLWNKLERRYLPLSSYQLLSLPPTNVNHEYDSESRVTGLRAAIALHADSVLQKLTENEQDIARRIFVQLAQFGRERPDTRRQMIVSDMRIASDSSMFETTLKYLADEKTAYSHLLVTKMIISAKWI